MPCEVRNRDYHRSPYHHVNFSVRQRAFSGSIRYWLIYLGPTLLTSCIEHGQPKGIGTGNVFRTNLELEPFSLPSGCFSNSRRQQPNEPYPEAESAENAKFSSRHFASLPPRYGSSSHHAKSFYTFRAWAAKDRQIFCASTFVRRSRR